VGDEQAGDVDFVVQPSEPAPESLPHFGVERAERFVKQQHSRLDGQSAGEGDALALAAGKLGRIAVRRFLQMNQPEQLPDPVADLRLGRPRPARPDPEPEGDILKYVHVPEQGIMLEHETHAALCGVLARHVLALEKHGAALVGVRDFETGHDTEQGGLARAGRTEEGHEFAVVDAEADVPQRGKAAEGLADMRNLDRHG
jgi:hypothetical protein